MSVVGTAIAIFSVVMPRCTTVTPGTASASRLSTGPSLDDASQLAGGQIAQRAADAAVVIDPDAGDQGVGQQPVGDRLTGVALLHADRQAVEVVDRSGHRAAG